MPRLQPRWTRNTSSSSWGNAGKGNKYTPSCWDRSCTPQFPSSRSSRVASSFPTWRSSRALQWDRISHTWPRSIRTEGLPELFNNYHDQFWSQFGLWDCLAVELVVLLYPAYRTDRDRYSLVAFWVVVVWDHHFIHQLDYLSRFFLVYSHIGLLVHTLHYHHQ